MGNFFAEMCKSRKRDKEKDDAKLQELLESLGIQQKRPKDSIEYFKVYNCEESF